MNVRAQGKLWVLTQQAVLFGSQTIRRVQTELLLASLRGVCPAAISSWTLEITQTNSNPPFFPCVSSNVCSIKVRDYQTKENTGSNMFHQMLNLENVSTRSTFQVVHKDLACWQGETEFSILISLCFVYLLCLVCPESGTGVSFLPPTEARYQGRAYQNEKDDTCP